MTFAHSDAITVLSRLIAELAIYPAIDSKSRVLDPPRCCREPTALTGASG